MLHHSSMINTLDLSGKRKQNDSATSWSVLPSCFISLRFSMNWHQKKAISHQMRHGRLNYKKNAHILGFFFFFMWQLWPTLTNLLLQQLVVNEPGLAVGERPSRRCVQVARGHGLHEVLKLPAVRGQKLVQACTRRGGGGEMVSIQRPHAWPVHGVRYI